MAIPVSNLLRPHDFPGLLVVVEGIDGSGKTTQAQLLRRWIESRAHPVFFTEWNSSALVKKATRTGKRKAILTPMTFCLLHATDFADRHMYKIVPPLKAGMAVVADRYAYTAFARDGARGVHPDWVRNAYSFAVRPDIALYFRVTPELALTRLRASRAKLKYYEAGMDMRLTHDVDESFLKFQGRVIAEYDRMAEQESLLVIDASRPIAEQQKLVRGIVAKKLGWAYRGEEA
ncbi:MAG: dTMP kinase [Phycisphaerales bacterium]|nr:dTMP kinase [Phycisphaerales bacterium]